MEPSFVPGQQHHKVIYIVCQVLANLPDPDVIAAEIIEDLEAALEELQAISDDLALTPGAQRGDADGKSD